MEPISTLNTGTSLAHQRELFPLQGLAVKARNLTAEQKSSGTEKDKRKELMEVAQKFEALLIHQMLKEMRKTVHKSDLLNSFSLQQYESMMDEEIASEMAKHKGIGLADNLFYQLSRLDKNSKPQTPSSNNFQKVDLHE